MAILQEALLVPSEARAVWVSEVQHLTTTLLDTFEEEVQSPQASFQKPRAPV